MDTVAKVETVGGIGELPNACMKKARDNSNSGTAALCVAPCDGADAAAAHDQQLGALRISIRGYGRSRVQSAASDGNHLHLYAARICLLRSPNFALHAVQNLTICLPTARLEARQSE